jgi:amidohydrolase
LAASLAGVHFPLADSITYGYVSTLLQRMKMSSTVDSKEIADFLPEITAIRRDLHEHPELGFQEERTSAIVARELRTLGIEVAEKVGGFGVVGTIRGSIAGTRTIGLRADMDALPIAETTGLPYASRTEGRMHACGHDGHTAMLLGAARYLAKHNDFKGTVHLIFQPAEETLKGALGMIEDGLLQRFSCDAIYGMHTGPGIPAAVFATLPGILMAGSGRFEIVFRGRGGHGGLDGGAGQELALVQAHFMTELEAYNLERKAEGHHVTATVGYLQGGLPDTYNVLPTEVRLQGTTRAVNSEEHGLLHAKMKTIAEAVAIGAMAVAEVQTWIGVPPLLNSSRETKLAVSAARASVGTDRVVTEGKPVPASEDFAFFLEKLPGAFIFLGNGVSPDGSFNNIHTPLFDFNDAVLPVGIQYWIHLVNQELPIG